MGVNDRGVLPGNFCGAPGCDPFIVEGAIYTPRRGGIFDTFTSEPPAQFVAPYDINDRGVSVGTIFEPTTIGQVAFVRDRKGEIEFLPDIVDDQLAAYAGGVNNRGVVSGAAITTAFEQVGFIAHPRRRGAGTSRSGRSFADPAGKRGSSSRLSSWFTT